DDVAKPPRYQLAQPCQHRRRVRCIQYADHRATQRPRPLLLEHARQLFELTTFRQCDCAILEHLYFVLRTLHFALCTSRAKTKAQITTCRLKASADPSYVCRRPWRRASRGASAWRESRAWSARGNCTPSACGEWHGESCGRLCRRPSARAWETRSPRSS